MKFQLINRSNSYSRKIEIQSADPNSCFSATDREKSLQKRGLVDHLSSTISTIK